MTRIPEDLPVVLNLSRAACLVHPISDVVTRTVEVTLSLSAV